MAAPDTGLARLFNPRSVALVGATDRSTWSKMAFDNLKLLGFEGKVHLVNRSGGVVHGQQSFKTAVDIGESVDVALLMVPYAVAANLPCIVAQRYNRPRLAALAERGRS